MNCYAIYTPISSIMHDFVRFVRFFKIQVYKLKTCDYKMFLRPHGSKKIA